MLLPLHMRAFVALASIASVGASFLVPSQPSSHAWRSGSCLARTRRGAAMMTAPTADAKPSKSFVQTEMRAAAMKLHTRQQAPKEGQQEDQTPVSKWEPGREEYLQFLVDSRNVYRCFEEIVEQTDVYASFRDSGLERVAALDKDIAWFESEGLKEPPLGKFGEEYAADLKALAAAEEWEKLTCHFYNFYFAHTAGGRMIGKMMSDKLLDGRTLEFYQWERGDPKEELLPRLREQIDLKAAEWTREQKDACLQETAASFKGGGSMLKYLREPQS